jgi:hypothetical protein
MEAIPRNAAMRTRVNTALAPRLQDTAWAARVNVDRGTAMTGLWKPETEQQLIEGIGSGALRENHYIEVKETARNEQIAQTLASLAIDGGIFIIGIAEQKNNDGRRSLTPKPLPLQGELERIDGISRNSIEPPLTVRITPIPAANDSSAGYLIISVPASPLAPHMTGGKYYGRGDASKYSLSDAEVLRHHERRQLQMDLARELLDEAERNDYLPPQERKHAHIHLIAEPLLPVSPDRVEEFLHDQHAVLQFVMSGQNRCRSNLVDWSPTPRYAGNIRQRSSGVSVVNNDANGPGRSMNPDGGSEPSLLDIELTHSGGIRIFVGRGSSHDRSTGERLIAEQLAVAYAQRLIYWTGQLAEKYGYPSTWTLGLRMTGIKGLRSSTGDDDFWDQRSRESMDSDAYSSVCTITTDMLADAPEDVAGKLVNRLLRVLGVANAYR